MTIKVRSHTRQSEAAWRAIRDAKTAQLAAETKAAKTAVFVSPQVCYDGARDIRAGAMRPEAVDLLERV